MQINGFVLEFGFITFVWTLSVSSVVNAGYFPISSEFVSCANFPSIDAGFAAVISAAVQSNIRISTGLNLIVSSEHVEVFVGLPVQFGAEDFVVIIIATVPMMAVYPWLQKYFAKGVMIGSVKG